MKKISPQKKEPISKKTKPKLEKPISTTEEKNLTKDNTNQSQSSYINYILTNQKNILLGILLIILLLPLALNNSTNTPLLTKSESYFHLYNSQQLTFQNPNYLFLYLAQQILPYNALILIPIILSIIIIFLLHKILTTLNFAKNTTFFFILFLLISPTVILELTNLTSSLLFLFYTSLSFTLLLHKKHKLNYLAIIPIILASLLTPYFTIFLTLTLIIYTIKNKKNINQNIITQTKSTNLSTKNKLTFNILLIIITLLLFIAQITLLNQQLFPSSIQKLIQPLNLEFISDFGSESGISIFILFLAIIGLTITWKKTNYSFAYFTLPFIATFFFDTQTIILLTIITTFFATIGLIKLLEMQWEIPTLKQFTILILILGLTFSTISYFNRISQIGPTENDLNSLTWIKENTPTDSVILSDPKNSEFINYFAQRQSFISNTEINKNTIQEYQEIIDAKYITELFPLLNNNNITFIYLNSHTTNPNYKYLIFLLKNEKFKMVHSSKETQVWVYNQK